MVDYVDTIIEFKTESVFWSRMKTIGLPEKLNEDGSRRKAPKRGFILMGGQLLGTDGTIRQRVRLLRDELESIPPVNNPSFNIVWRSDVRDEEGGLLPEDSVEVVSYDIDGNVGGTRMQGVGTF